MRIISLGWGVQSWTLAAMSALGELPPVDAAIHADTTWERRHTYEFARQWTPWLEARGVRVVTVSEPAVAGAVVNRWDGTFIPAYTISAKGDGQLRRQCTDRWKIQPMRRWLSAELEHRSIAKAPGAVEQWLGISLDEFQRMKDSDVRWIRHRFPLIERRMSRAGCLAWLERHDLPSPGKSSCTFCFAGDTEVLTPDGARPIRELVGWTRLLVPIPQSGWGTWQDVEVRSFGVQPVVQVRLRRGRITKTLYVTPEHRWVTQDKTSGVWQKFTPTTGLQKGDRLPICRAHSVRSSGRYPIRMSPFGVARGFVFGDGSVVRNRERAPAQVTLHGDKDQVMLPYFALCEPREIMLPSGKTGVLVYGLPRFWKTKLPSLDDSKGYLLGWLAGYFAADGHVSKRGQATLYSTHYDHLRFVRDVCYLLGVQTSPIKEKQRQGVNGVEPLYSVDLYSRDLPGEFWLHSHHCERMQQYHATTTARREGWVVEAIEPAGRAEEVFCAIVPGVEMFVLADNIVTGNCPYHSRAAWQRIKRAGGADWQQALEIDAVIRDKRPPYPLYVHPARKPLGEAVVIPEDFGAEQLSLFDEISDDMPCDSGYCFL